MGEGQSRRERARALLERWSHQGDPRAFLFGSESREVELQALLQAIATHDDETRLLDAIEDVSARAGRNIGAVVLLSDGADTGSSIELPALGKLGIRVHTVDLSAGNQVHDDSVAEVKADPVAFLRQDAKVQVVIRSSAGAGTTLPVSLMDGDRVVREGVAEIDEQGEGRIELTIQPPRLGRAVYRVVIPVAPDDAVPENNERAFLVRVIRDRLRALLVAGEPTWDVRFLRSFLKRDPSVDLVSFFILRTTSDLTMADSEELALIPFPTDELFREHLGSFDVVIFQNFDFGPYQMSEYLARIGEYVRRGGSFVMVGGDRSFGVGGYGNTPIADVLPVSLGNEQGAAATVLGPFQPRLVSELARHPLVALLPDPSANGALWRSLAPVEGANITYPIETRGKVLLTHPTHRTGGGGLLPILSVGEAEAGRVMALMIDTSWHWGITTGGVTGDASMHERFWDRALRWLARDPALEPSRVTTDRERYGPRGVVRVEGRYRDQRYVPATHADATLVIYDSVNHARDKRPVTTDAKAMIASELQAPEEPGAYRVVLVDAEGTNLAEEWFLVEAGGDELADPRPRPSLLRAIAEATGGQFIADPADAPPLDALDATRTQSLGVVRTAPFSSALIVGLLLLLLGTEWIVRRRWGRR